MSTPAVGHESPFFSPVLFMYCSLGLTKRVDEFVIAECYNVCIDHRYQLTFATIISCRDYFPRWSELSFSMTHPTLSVYAIMIDHAAEQENYTSLEFLSFVTLLYLCLCTYVMPFFFLVPCRCIPPTARMACLSCFSFHVFVAHPLHI